MRYTLVAFSPYISFVASVSGIICYFTGLFTITLICGLITLLDSAIQVFWGEQNNFVTEIITIIIGAMVALIFHLPFFACIFLFLCIGSAFMMLFGWISLLFMR